MESAKKKLRYEIKRKNQMEFKCLACGSDEFQLDKILQIQTFQDDVGDGTIEHKQRVKAMMHCKNGHVVETQFDYKIEHDKINLLNLGVDS